VVAAAVIAEFLAVIGRRDDDRARPPLGETPHERAERRIGGGDFRIVAVDVAVAERVLGMGFVRLVRAEQVHPQEKRTVALRPLEVAVDLRRRSAPSANSTQRYSKSSERSFIFSK
jgi:hypothetical protein